MADTSSDNQHCASDTRCRAYDHIAKHAAWTEARNPLCDPCLTSAERDVRVLVYDYVDLAQLQTPTLSQAMDAQPRGKAAPPMPLRGEPEALQQEIHHVTTLWATELRTRLRLNPHHPAMIVGAWHTTVSNPPPLARRLPGGDVERAVGTLAPRLAHLARIGPITVYPTGCEDDPQDMAGWEAVHHLQRLRARARGMLGWTHRVYWIPGACPNDYCGRHELYRADPRHADDDPPVTCDRCGTWRTSADYEHYVANLVWPEYASQAAA